MEKDRVLIVDVDIKILGNSGSGKTTLAFIIKNALEEYGYKVNHTAKTFIDIDEKENSLLVAKSKMIQQNSDLKINITEHQIIKKIF